MINRFHTASRWPADRDARIELARTDVAFAKVIMHVLSDTPLLSCVTVPSGVPLRVQEELCGIHMRARWVLKDEGVAL